MEFSENVPAYTLFVYGPATPVFGMFQQAISDDFRVDVEGFAGRRKRDNSRDFAMYPLHGRPLLDGEFLAGEHLTGQEVGRPQEHHGAEGSPATL
jgi:hypothetical protein